MDAGMLDRLVTIEYKSGVTQEPVYGTQEPAWSAIPNGLVWANFQDVQPSRAESVKLGRAEARNQTKITIVYRADVTSAMRIVDSNGAIYQIVGGPAEIGRRTWTEMMGERYT